MDHHSRGARRFQGGHVLSGDHRKLEDVCVQGQDDHTSRISGSRWKRDRGVILAKHLGGISSHFSIYYGMVAHYMGVPPPTFDQCDDSIASLTWRTNILLMDPYSAMPLTIGCTSYPNPINVDLRISGKIDRIRPNFYYSLTCSIELDG